MVETETKSVLKEKITIRNEIKIFCRNFTYTQIYKLVNFFYCLFVQVLLFKTLILLLLILFLVSIERIIILYMTKEI